MIFLLKVGLQVIHFGFSFSINYALPMLLTNKFIFENKLNIRTNSNMHIVIKKKKLKQNKLS